MTDSAAAWANEVVDAPDVVVSRFFDLAVTHSDNGALPPGTLLTIFPPRSPVPAEGSP